MDSKVLDAVRQWLHGASGGAVTLTTVDGSGFAAVAVDGVDVVVEVDAAYDLVRFTASVHEATDSAGPAVRALALELNFTTLLPAGMGLGVQPGGNELFLSMAIPSAFVEPDRLTIILSRFVAEARAARERLADAGRSAAAMAPAAFAGASPQDFIRG